MDMKKVEKLIEIVRGHPFLFDLGHQQYKNASLKSEIWESIGKELNESGDAVRSKWKTVRDGYTKYRKQLKSSKGSSRKYVSYTWASQLSFLDNYNVPRASSSNVSSEATHLPQQAQSPGLDSDNSQDMILQSNPALSPTQHQYPDLPTNTSAASTSKISLHKSLSRIRRNDDDIGRVLRFINAKKKKEHDVVDNLFLSYADTFKKFPPREQAVVKLELAKLFSSIELRLINDNNPSESQFQYSSIISPTCSTVSSDDNVKLYSPRSQQMNVFGDENISMNNSEQLFLEDCDTNLIIKTECTQNN